LAKVRCLLEVDQALELGWDFTNEIIEILDRVGAFLV
jgi:hypothetical protein